MIVLDTSYLIALKNKEDIDFERANQIQEDLLNKKYGKIFLTDYIFDEFVTFLRKKLRNPREVIKLGEDLLHDKDISILGVTKLDFRESWKIFKKYENLSFTDATTITLTQKFDIKYVCSFDKNFDCFKNLERIC